MSSTLSRQHHDVINITVVDEPIFVIDLYHTGCMLVLYGLYDINYIRSSHWMATILDLVSPDEPKDNMPIDIL